jgi:hypothetical protein
MLYDREETDDLSIIMPYATRSQALMSVTATSGELVSAYHELAGILGPEIEPLAVFERVEQHRTYWRPDRTRVLLLAESHVYTSVEELKRIVRPYSELPAEIPMGFVRLVYCLGYGENGWLDQPIAYPRNSGTPQFWKIFQSCLKPISANADCAGLLATQTRDAQTRLCNKLAMLTELRRRGIWLVDASVAALYRADGHKPPPQLREAVLKASWEMYVRDIVQAADPEAILCIGVGVGRVLASRLARLGIPWAAQPQPQARLPSSEHLAILNSYYRVCDDPQRIHEVRRWL